MSVEPRIIVPTEQFELTLNRLCFQLIENHDTFENTALIGIKPRGHYLSQRIKQKLQELAGVNLPYYGELDITFYRDDFRRRDTPLRAETTDIPFIVEGKRVVLIDDVLFTGRTIRAALDALLDFGRPEKVELLVLIDRRLKRQLPIEPNYIGQMVDTIASEKVQVEWRDREGEDKILLFTSHDKK